MLAKKYSRQEVCQVVDYTCAICHIVPLEKKGDEEKTLKVAVKEIAKEVKTYKRCHITPQLKELSWKVNGMVIKRLTKRKRLLCPYFENKKKDTNGKCLLYYLIHRLYNNLTHLIICVISLIGLIYPQSDTLSDFLPLTTLRGGSSGTVLFPTNSSLPKGTQAGGVSSIQYHLAGAEIVYGRTNNMEIGFFHFFKPDDATRSIGGIALKQRLGGRVSAGLSLFQGKIHGVKGFLVTSFLPEKSLSLHLGCGVLYWKYGNLKRQELLPYMSLIWEMSKRWRLVVGVQDRRDFATKPSYFLSIHSHLNRQIHLGLGLVQSGFSERPLLFVSFAMDKDIFAHP